jgi:DNA-binding transcriptional regulator YiaG
MERKIERQFVDHGCGFPVLLLNVPMIKVRGKWIPDINYEMLEKSVLLDLCHKPYKLTGSEIRFIRLYFEMTLQAFGKRFGVQHPTVIKWEKCNAAPTNMTLGTEKDIRLFVIKTQVAPPSAV